MTLNKSETQILDLALQFAKVLGRNDAPDLFLQNHPVLLSPNALQVLRTMGDIFRQRNVSDSALLMDLLHEFLERCMKHGTDHMLQFFAKYGWDFPQYFIAKDTVSALLHPDIRKQFLGQIAEMQDWAKKRNDVSAIQLCSAILNLLDGMHLANIRTDKLAGISLKIWQAILEEVEIQKSSSDPLDMIFQEIALTEVNHANAAQIASLCRQGLDLVNDKRSDRAAVLFTTLGRVLLLVTNNVASGDIEEAIDCFNHALKVETYERNRLQWLGLNVNLGVAYQMRIKGRRPENLAHAVDLLTKVLEDADAEESATLWCFAHMNLGMCYLDIENDDKYANLQKALSHLSAALEVANPELYPEIWGSVHLNLSKCYLTLLGFKEHLEETKLYYEKILFHAKQSMEVYTREEFPAQWAAINNNIAGLHYLQGDLMRALRHFQDVYDVRTGLNMPEALETLQNIALVYSDLSPKDAIDIHQTILAGVSSEENPSVWSHSNWELARHYLSELSREPKNRRYLLNQIISHADQAIMNKERTVFPEDHFASLSTIATAYFLLKDWGNAHAYFLQALDTATGNNDLTYTDIGRNQKANTVSSVCISLSECLIHMKEFTQAFEYLERAKTQNLHQALVSNHLHTEPALSQDVNPDQFELISKIKRLELYLREEHAKNPLALDQKLLTELKVARNQYRQMFLFNEAGTSFAELAAVLEEDTLVVAPLILEERSYLFIFSGGTTILTQENVIEIDLTRQALQRLIDGGNDSDPDESTQSLVLNGQACMSWNLANYFLVHDTPFYTRDGILREWKKSFDAISHELWKYFVQPFGFNLASRGIRNILFLHQGGTQVLPIHAACNRDGGRGKYLIEEYNFRYAPSLKVLWQIRLNHQSHRTLEIDMEGLAVSISEYTKYPDLEFVDQEVDFLARLFPRSQSLFNIGKDVFEQEHRNKQFLHLACHAFFSTEKNPMKSGLVFANDTPLTLMEIIANYDFSKYSFVTLSACETGMVKIFPNPEEFIGLPYGFLQSGAPTIISSLWSVSDFSTALLMILFYGRIQAGENLFHALANAQRVLLTRSRKEISQMIKNDPKLSSSLKLVIIQHLLGNDENINEIPYSHPYYWASFSVLGVA